MLNDHEQRVLRELEQQFLTDDPEFPRSFAARAQRLGRTGLAMPTRLAIVVALLLSTSMLAAGSLTGALAAWAVTGLVWLAWRHSAAHATRPPDGEHSS